MRRQESDREDSWESATGVNGKKRIENRTRANVKHQENNNNSNQ
jgi:hypothetical protein